MNATEWKNGLCISLSLLARCVGSTTFSSINCNAESTLITTVLQLNSVFIDLPFLFSPHALSFSFLPPFSRFSPVALAFLHYCYFGSVNVASSIHPLGRPASFALPPRTTLTTADGGSSQLNSAQAGTHSFAFAFAFALFLSLPRLSVPVCLCPMNAGGGKARERDKISRNRRESSRAAEQPSSRREPNRRPRASRPFVRLVRRRRRFGCKPGRSIHPSVYQIYSMCVCVCVCVGGWVNE